MVTMVVVVASTPDHQWELVLILEAALWHVSSRRVRLPRQGSRGHTPSLFCWGLRFLGWAAALGILC